MLLMLIYVPVSLLLSLSMARWADRCKNIGFWWTFYLSITLSPVAGYIFAKMSGNKRDVLFMPTLTQIIILMLCFLTPLGGGWLFIAGLQTFFPLGWALVLLGSGLAGAAMFGILLVFQSKSDDDIFGMH